MVENQTDQPAVATVVVSPKPPELTTGKLALIHVDDKVQIGMKQEEALSVFPKPTSNALSVDALPKGFPSETYVSSGWESTDGGDGFGVICTTEFNTKRVAVAILRMRMDSRDAADSIVSQYKTVLGETGLTTQVSGELTYTLWKEDSNELMILEAPLKGGKCQLTLALGVSPLTSALRFDAASVRRDTVALSKQSSEPSKP